MRHVFRGKGAVNKGFLREKSRGAEGGERRFLAVWEKNPSEGADF
jgi:hypothetical protein